MSKLMPKAFVSKFIFGIICLLTFSFSAVQAQIEVKVAFNRGFIGVVGSNTNTADNIKKFTTLGIDAAYFVQSTVSGRFELTSGNNIAGTLRLRLTNGTNVDMPGTLVWRKSTGATIEYFGFLADATVNLNLNTYGGTNYSIVGGTANGNSNFGFQKNGSTYSIVADAATESGNAASGSTALADLNAYLDAPKFENPLSITFLENAVNATPGLLYPSTTSQYSTASPSFTGKTLKVNYTNSSGTDQTGISQDLLAVRNVGTGAGQVNVTLGSPNTIKVGSTTVGTYPSSLTGSGVTGEYLQITWVGSPTLAQVNAVINSITYQNNNNNPTAVRYVKLTILDGVTTVTNQMTVNVTPENDAPQAGANTTRSDVTGSSDPISGYPTPYNTCPTCQSGSNSPSSEGVANAIDNNSSTKYLNFYSANSGFVVTPNTGASIVTKLTFTTANDASERDPLTFKLEGSRDGGGTYTTIVNSGNTNMSTNRFAFSESAEFVNTEWYTTYRITFPTLRSGPIMQIGEVELLGVPFRRIAQSVYSNTSVNVHPNLPIVDVDNNDQIASAVVTISTNFNPRDVLTWTNQAGITGAYNTSTGVLSFTGTATPATYQTLLRSVKFATSAPNSVGKERLITFQVTDQGGLNSNLAESRVVVSYPPTLTSVNNLGTANRTVATNITYAMLSGAAQGFSDDDPSDLPLKFKIKSVGTNGTLTKNGVAIAAGDIVATGETLVWTPATTATNVTVMSVRAFDGDFESASDVTVTMNVQNLPAPAITSFTPTIAGNGETVVITGTNFTGSTVVKFGNVNATSFVVNSDTQITAVVGSAASGGVYVQNPSGNDTKTGFIYKIVQYNFENNTLDATASAKNGTANGAITYAPGVEGQAVCFDRTNTTSGGNWIVMPSNLIRSLTDFTVSLRFRTNSKGIILGYQNSAVNGTGGNYIPILLVQSDGKLRATLWTSANRDMSVLSPAAVNDGNWHKVDMSITTTSINIYIDGVLAGSTSSGTVAHLDMTFNQLGRGLTDAARESAGGNLTGWQGFTGCIDNFLILDKGQSLATINQATQLPAPTITSFTPTTAKNGETITITGTNLSGVTSVKIGGVEARSFTSVSATQLTAVVANSSNLNNDVVLTTAGGAVTATGFNYVCESNALSFDGQNDYVTVGDVLENFSTVTQEAWVYWKGSNLDFSEIFTKEAISAFAITRDNKLHANFGNGSTWGGGVNSTTSIPLNKWTHVAVTRDGSNVVRLYINGVLDASTATIVQNGQNANSRLIGAKLVGSTLYGPFNGAIDELRFWNVTRTAAQISATLGSELNGNEAGLVAYYNFNQGIADGNNTSITTLNNLSIGSGLNGTVTNMALTGTNSNFVTGVGPVIIKDPINTTACLNATTGNTLSVNAVGQQLVYQWYRNNTNSNTGGTAINGATSSTFTPSTATIGTGYFYVVVSSSCNSTSVTSDAAAFEVIDGPTLSYPSLTYTANKGETITPIPATATNATSFGVSPALPSGLVLNTSTGEISGTVNGLAGTTTHTITAYSSGACTASVTATLTIVDQTCNVFSSSDFQLNGNATYSNNQYTLTTNTTQQSGSLWNKTKLFLDKSFDISARVFLGNNDAGADGIAFVLQSQSLNAGSSGGGLGYFGITPSFAVEFDTYNNSGIEPVGDHIALIANGATAGAHNTYSIPYVTEMEDGQWHDVRFVWNPTTKNFQVWYEGVLRHNVTVDLKANIFNNQSYVYWGFTGATGGATNLQRVELPQYCYVQQAQITKLAGTNNANASATFCVGGTVQLQSTTASSYQWYKNNVAIQNATSQTLEVSEAGSYTVETVTGLQNTTTSDPVVVTINALPAVSYGSTPYRVERTVAITSISPTSTGAAANNYVVSPALPQGLAINATTGVISGTPTAVSAATIYTVTATTAGGCSTTASFSLEVYNAVAPSALTYSPDNQTVRQGTAITAMSPSASGDPARYSISPALPSGLTINANTGLVSGTLNTTATGTITYTVTATNSGGSTSSTITLVYNTAPTNITISSNAVDENAVSGTVVGTIAATDADNGDTHTYALVSGSGSTDNASFTIAGNQLKTAEIFDFETKSSYSIRVKATDAGGLSFEKAFTITVNDLDNEDTDSDGVPDFQEKLDGTDFQDPTKYKDADLDVVPNYVELQDGTNPNDGKSYKDTDGDGVPDYVEILDGTNPNDATRFKDSDGGGVPDYVEEKLYPLYGVPATNPAAQSDDNADTDGDGMSDYQEILAGRNPNSAPANLSYNPSAIVGQKGTALSAITPTYTSGKPRQYSISPALPAGLTLNTTTGAISGTPTSLQTTAVEYTIIATNNGGSAAAKVTIKVNDVPPTALVYTPTTQLIEQGKPIINMSAASGGGPVVSYSISPALPAGLVFNTTTGVISGTRTQVVSGKVQYTITATNSGGSTTTLLTINYNTTPTDITISKANIYEGNKIGDIVGTMSTTDVDAADVHTYTLVKDGADELDNRYFKFVGNRLAADTTFKYYFKSSYTIKVRTTDSEGLYTEKKFVITISLLPEVVGTSSEAYISSTFQGSTNISKTPIVSKGYSSQLEVRGNEIAGVRWSPGTGLSSTTSLRPVFKNNTTVNYVVTVTNVYGSIVDIPFTVEVRDDYFLKASNILTTRKDGINDYFTIENIENYPDNEVTIFDRNGKILTKMSNYNNRWDGKVDGKALSTDTYYYLIRFTSKPGAVVKGFITIINN